MSTNAFFERGVDFLASFTPVRPSTLAVLLLITSTWIYFYARKAIKYRVRCLMLEGVWILLLIDYYSTIPSSGSGAVAILQQLSLSISGRFALDIVKSGFRAGRQKKLLAFFTKHFDQLSPTAEVSILGGIGYVTQDPENIEAVLSTHFQGKTIQAISSVYTHRTLLSDREITLDFHLGPRSMTMRAMIGEGIFTQDGVAWKHSREVLRRQFMRMQYQNLEGFREHLDNLIERLNASSGITDVQPMFYRLTLDTTIAMILGQPVESFKHEIGDFFSKAFDKASLVTGTRARLGDMYFLYRPRGFFKACDTIKRYTHRFVTDTLRREEESLVKFGKSSFISELHRDNQDLQLVRDQVINVLLAGRDTTAATMSYALLVNEILSIKTNANTSYLANFFCVIQMYSSLSVAR